MMNCDLPLSVTHEVRDRCFCLHVRRAARSLGRFFDDAMKPAGITNGQFSLLMALNRPDRPRLGDLVQVLGMDRTTLTAALKPLERRGLVHAVADESDGRVRRLMLTDTGHETLLKALPIWRACHDALDARLSGLDPDVLRQALVDIA